MPILGKFNGEKVRLVESFGELKAGMILWCECRCDTNHRGIATGPIQSNSHGAAFEIAPRPDCLPLPYQFVIPREAVQARKVWTVVDDDITEVSTAPARELETVK